jgi:hypothetical protein
LQGYVALQLSIERIMCVTLLLLLLLLLLLYSAGFSEEQLVQLADSLRPAIIPAPRPYYLVRALGAVCRPASGTNLMQGMQQKPAVKCHMAYMTLALKHHATCLQQQECCIEVHQLLLQTAYRDPCSALPSFFAPPLHRVHHNHRHCPRTPGCSMASLVRLTCGLSRLLCGR